MEQPYAGRLRWHYLGGRVQLRLRQPFPWTALLGLAVVAVGSSFWRPMLPKNLTAWRQLGFPEILFPLLVGAWLLAAVGTVGGLLLTRETLTVGLGEVEISRQLAGWTFWRRRFAVRDIRGLAVEDREHLTDGERRQWPRFREGTLHFEVNDASLAFGRRLDPAEVRAALHELVRQQLLPGSLLAAA